MKPNCVTLLLLSGMASSGLSAPLLEGVSNDIESNHVTAEKTPTNLSITVIHNYPAAMATDMSSMLAYLVQALEPQFQNDQPRPAAVPKRAQLAALDMQQSIPWDVLEHRIRTTSPNFMFL